MIKTTKKLKSTETKNNGKQNNPIKAEPAAIARSMTQPVNAQLALAPVSKPVLARPAPLPLPKVNGVALQLINPNAKTVAVAGSFNEWNPARTPLKRTDEGKWVGELTGITGRHEYLFVVDGQWLPDPNAKESVQNPFGGRNSVLVVSA